MGEYYHQKVEKIKTKKQCYKAKSFFRKALDLIRSEQTFMDLWQESICAFIRWIDLLLLIISIL
jgi:hypothetical protein